MASCIYHERRKMMSAKRKIWRRGASLVPFSQILNLSCVQCIAWQ